MLFTELQECHHGIPKCLPCYDCHQEHYLEVEREAPPCQHGQVDGCTACDEQAMIDWLFDDFQIVFEYEGWGCEYDEDAMADAYVPQQSNIGRLGSPWMTLIKQGKWRSDDTRRASSRFDKTHGRQARPKKRDKIRRGYRANKLAMQNESWIPEFYDPLEGVLVKREPDLPRSWDSWDDVSEAWWIVTGWAPDAEVEA